MQMSPQSERPCAGPFDSSLSFLTHIPVKKHSEIESIIDSLILLKEESKNTDSKEILILKEQLVEANKKIERLNLENIANNKDKLLEREAVKYFSRGVVHPISNESEKAIKEYKTALELKPDL